MKYLILFVLLPLLSLAANPGDSYRMCLNASNKPESPADRDAQKINCFNQGRAKKSVDLCVNLARVLEHTTSSDALIVGCISDNIFKMKMDECVSTAKKLYYSDTRDRALWTCIENISVKRSRCKAITDEITFPHIRNRAFNYCLSKN